MFTKRTEEKFGRTDRKVCFGGEFDPWLTCFSHVTRVKPIASGPKVAIGAHHCKRGKILKIDKYV